MKIDRVFTCEHRTSMFCRSEMTRWRNGREKKTSAEAEAEEEEEEEEEEMSKCYITNDKFN